MDLRKAACAAAVCCLGATMAWARGGWQDPPGGWDYLYEANAGQAQYLDPPTGDTVTGLLDATWIGGIETYLWDGSAPGVYDPANADGAAPGGAELVTRTGLGDGGGDATVLAFEVVGDTTVATGNPFDFAWTSPANEAIYFIHPTPAPGQTSGTASIKQGMTVIARMRLTPNPKDVEPPAGQNWATAGFTTDGKGMLSVVDQDDINASISFRPDGKLYFLDQYDLNYAGSPTAFVSVWMTALLTDLDTYRVEIYLNGSSTAAFAQEIVAPPDGDESGTDPDDYIAFGLPVEGVAAAMELDYIGYKVGFMRPGQTQAPPSALSCAIDTAVTPTLLNLTWTIPAGAVYDAIQVLADGVVLETIPGTSTAWSTSTLLPGQHPYQVRAVVGGTPLLPVTCFVSYCVDPNTEAVIDYTRQPPAAHVTWDPPGYPVTRIQVAREGVVLADNLPPSALEYWDATLTPADGEVAYELTLVPETGLPCAADVTRHVVILPAEAAYLDPDGGWDYVYDPDAHDPVTNAMDKYVAEKGVEGCLDGSWIRSYANDNWDGAAPGNSTPPDDPSPIAPGGVEIRDRAGEGINGENVKTLAIEDPGDPTGSGYVDPSNRKIVLGHVLEPPDNPLGGRYAEGVTMYVRFRLTPDPRDVPDPPNGDPVRDSSHGMITLCYYDGDSAADVDATGSRSFGMSLNGDVLDVSDGGDIAGLEPGKWVSVWFMTQDTDRNGAYHSSVYLNGDMVPIKPDWRRSPDDANVTIDRWEELLFADTAQAFTAVVVGGIYSGNDCAFEIDFIKIKYGVVTPTNGIVQTPPVTNLACAGTGSDVTLSWTNGDTYDSIEVREGPSVLATLAGTAVGTTLTAQADGAHVYRVFAVKGGTASTGVACTVTVSGGTGDTIAVFMGNINTDATVNIADAVSLLSYLFAQKAPPVCAKAADANDDDKLDVADAVSILGYLFGGKTMKGPDGGLFGPGKATTCTDYPADGTDQGGKPLFPASVGTLPTCQTPCR